MLFEDKEIGLAALEAQPRPIREKLLSRIAEAWMEGQRKARGAYRNIFGQELGPGD